MSRKVLQTLRDMQADWKKNEPRVRRQFARAGISPDSSVILACALYYEALRKLARE